MRSGHSTTRYLAAQQSTTQATLRAPRHLPRNPSRVRVVSPKILGAPKIFENERPKNRKNVCPIHCVWVPRARIQVANICPSNFPPVERSRRENHQEISTKNVSPQNFRCTQMSNEKFGEGTEPFTHNSAGGPPHGRGSRTMNSGRARDLSHTTRRAHRREPCRRKPGLGERHFYGPCRWSCLGLCLTLA